MANEPAVLVYLSYGPEHLHRENRFSVLTALHQLSVGGDRASIAVYTDDAAAFSDLPVDVHPLQPDEVERWAGKPHAYNNRAKTMAMMTAHEQYGRPLVYLDGDTWWKRPLHHLLSKIRPGGAVMHLPEGRLLEVPDRRHTRLSEHLAQTTFTTTAGTPFTVSANAVMWNSGVVGIHPQDAHLLHEASALSQQIWDGLPGQPHLEQFALGHVLAQHVQLADADADVFHYWMAHLREPFRRSLPSLMESLDGLPVQEQARRAYAARPRPQGVQRGRVLAKRAMRTAGLRTARIRSSA